jgi:voltage-gated potassium channel
MIKPDDATYVTSLEEITWGIGLVAVTLAMHGIGMIATLLVSARFKRRFETRFAFLVGLGSIILASWMIIFVHLTEVVVWASFFLWKGAMPSASLSFYFALMDYTTLGSNYNLPLRWRLLEGMIAIAGLLTFAWSTGVLFTLAQSFQDQQMKLIKEREMERRP